MDILFSVVTSDNYLRCYSCKHFDMDALHAPPFPTMRSIVPSIWTEGLLASRRRTISTLCLISFQIDSGNTSFLMKLCPNMVSSMVVNLLVYRTYLFVISEIEVRTNPETSSLFFLFDRFRNVFFGVAVDETTGCDYDMHVTRSLSSALSSL